MFTLMTIGLKVGRQSLAPLASSYIILEHRDQPGTSNSKELIGMIFYSQQNEGHFKIYCRMWLILSFFQPQTEVLNTASLYDKCLKNKAVFQEQFAICTASKISNGL